MASEMQRRIWELALENLENKKKQLDLEIAEIKRELQRGGGRKQVAASVRETARSVSQTRKKARFTKEERLRRAQRMKAYWENWRKQRSKQK